MAELLIADWNGDEIGFTTNDKTVDIDFESGSRNVEIDEKDALRIIRFLSDWLVNR